MASDLVPTGQKINRDALERIVKRAAELQAHDHEIGEGLTDSELMALGQEVGIPSRYLQQALVEERTRDLTRVERGFVTSLVGASRVAAERVLSGEPQKLQTALTHWMTEGELLTVKRRYPDVTSWEARSDMLASLKRSLGFSGRKYMLARAGEVVCQLTPLEEGRCHLRLVADMSNTRSTHLAGAAALFGFSVLATGAALFTSVAIAAAIIPIPLGLIVAYSVARRRLLELDRVQVALEQTLDRLEHGEIEVPREVKGPRQSAFVRMAEEIKKSLGA